jgi:hypothetical protein
LTISAHARREPRIERKPLNGGLKMCRVNPSKRLARRSTRFSRSMTEYIVILVLVAIACVDVYSSFGGILQDQTAEVTVR